jgi:hypothetical protein
MRRSINNHNSANTTTRQPKNNSIRIMKKFSKIIGSGIGVAAALVISASITQAQTIVDPNFAGPGTANPITVAGVDQGWATFNNGGTAALGNDMSASLYYPLGYPTVTTAMLETAGPGNGWSPAGAYQIISGITPGQTYTFSVWALTDTANDGYAATAGVLVQLGFETAALGGASSVENPGNTVGIDGALPAVQGVWTEYSVSATAPAGYTDAIMYCMFQDNNSATLTENLYWDGAHIAPAPEPSTLALVSMGLAVPFYFIRRRKA